MNKIAKMMLWTGGVVCGFLVAWGGVAAAAPKPCNKVAVIIDGSGSYKNRQPQAVARAVALLEEMARTKVRRWEKDDEITLISLDAMPDVIFKGSLQDLKATTADVWVNRFKARSDYVKHTDLVAAFSLASRRLEGDPRYVGKYILAFTDLIHDPIQGPAPKKGKPAPPPEDFPFADLEDTSITVLWCPFAQKQAWLPVLQQYGLGESFQIYTTSESAEVKTTPPPKAKVKRPEGELAAKRQQVRSWFSVLGWCMGTVAASIFILPIAGLLWRRFKGPRPPRSGNPLHNNQR